MGVTEGVNDIEPYGQQVRIFLDISDNVGDDRVMNAFAYLMGQNANRPCSLCMCDQGNGTPNAELVYSSDIHSRLLSFTHLNECMNIIWSKWRFDTDVRQLLGMKCEKQDKRDTMFDFRIATAFVKWRSPTRTTREVSEAVSTSFESCLPYHGLSGLIYQSS